MTVDHLARAIAAARARLAEAEAETPMPALDQRIWTLGPVRPLESILRRPEKVHLIPEIARARPGSGADPPAEATAVRYAEAGAAALLVRAEAPHAAPDPARLRAARGAGLPVIRRDLLVSPYQVAESRVAGADALTLVAPALGEVGLRQMLAAAGRYGLTAIVEVHDAGEIDTAVECGARILCVVARDPRSWRPDPERCLALAGRLPKDGIRIADPAAIRSEIVRALREARYDAVVVGEAPGGVDDTAGLLAEVGGPPA